MSSPNRERCHVFHIIVALTGHMVVSAVTSKHEGHQFISRSDQSVGSFQVDR